MNPSSVLIVTAFDAKHFDLAQDMAASYRSTYQDRYRLAAIVYGPTAAPPELTALFDEIRHIPDDGTAGDGYRGFFMAYSGWKARLRDVFPGYGCYCWIDADCWFQGDASIPRILAGVPRSELCIHPECDVHYLNYPTPSERTLSIYRTNEGDQLAAMPLRMPMVNSGVLAMRTDSRVWSLWESEMTRLRERHQQGEAIFFSDQIPLHKLIYLHQVRIYPLRAIDNWQTYACPPLVDTKNRRLRVPTPPHEEIGLMHLAGNAKHQLYPIGERQMTLRYRDVRALFGD